MCRDTEPAAIVNEPHGGPERAQGRDIHDVACREVAQQVATLIGYLDAGNEAETVSGRAVKAPRRAGSVGAVMVGDGEQIKIGFLFHIAQQRFGRLISIAPRIVAGV